MPYTLVLLRHGQSEWNLKNLFTGWYDCDLSEQGEQQATAAGRQMLEHGLLPDVLHTSVQVRAIRTADLALREMGRSWIPVRRHWRLNERHYGALQGLDKAATAEKFGIDQVKVWRRSYDIPPPPLDPTDERSAHHDVRYADLPPELVPDTECLKDVVERMLPYWYDAVVPDLVAGKVTLVSAHGNSLRALVKHLDGISDREITDLNIPTGEPLVYQLGPDFRPSEEKPVEDRYLSSPEDIRAKAEAVARQAGGK
ncbi:MAG TPA: 2,3-diphosphoglycerate-dependent phosphoglycerate mutase [Acidimicrobiales bacterium]